jgi:hypothetical protein
MGTLYFILSIFAAIGFFESVKKLGRHLKRQREIQEANAEARKLMEDYEQKEKGSRGTGNLS